MQEYLPRCINSVRDQNISLEHIVIDGASSDGTKKWLQQQKDVKWLSEKDNGMYDALNKGLSLASGAIIGHLNADEQYLESSLEKVVNFFDSNPHIDFVVGDFLLVDKDGELIAFRKSFPTFWPFFFSNYLYAYTCTLFYRRSVTDQLKYNCAFKSVADVDFVFRMERMGFKGAHMRSFIAAFTQTGKNLSENPMTKIERAKYEKENLPDWFAFARPFLKIGFLLARILYGTLQHKGKLRYALYEEGDLTKRKEFIKLHPSYKWHHKVSNH
jgi:glycosyltransferase involved in cell wall biosynthesis